MGDDAEEDGDYDEHAYEEDEYAGGEYDQDETTQGGDDQAGDEEDDGATYEQDEDDNQYVEDDDEEGQQDGDDASTTRTRNRMRRRMMLTIARLMKTTSYKEARRAHLMNLSGFSTLSCARAAVSLRCMTSVVRPCGCLTGPSTLSSSPGGLLPQVVLLSLTFFECLLSSCRLSGIKRVTCGFSHPSVLSCMSLRL